MYFFFSTVNKIPNTRQYNALLNFTVVSWAKIHDYGLFHSRNCTVFLELHSLITIVIDCLHFRMLAVSHEVACAVPPGYKMIDSPSLQHLRC